METLREETKHTPTPWTLLSARTLVNIKGPEGRQVGQLPINNPDAQFIVRAVNAHEDLLHLAEYVSKADFKWGMNRKQAKHLALKALSMLKQSAQTEKGGSGK